MLQLLGTSPSTLLVIASWIKSTNLGMPISWSIQEGGTGRGREGYVFVIVRQNVVVISFGS
jgi:hypothetical protein